VLRLADRGAKRCYVGRIHSRKHKVTVWRPSVRLSVCPVSILTVTHQGAACDPASVHFGPTIRRIDVLVYISFYSHSRSLLLMLNCLMKYVFGLWTLAVPLMFTPGKIFLAVGGSRPGFNTNYPSCPLW